jgi:plasmid stabilization system protein ParE
MPVRTWSPKRERQYEHIKEGMEKRGVKNEKAEEIAARTVNKERARAGESKQASPTSINDISSSRRGGLRSHGGPAGPTYDQLRNEARQRGIRGRSRMTKSQLARALGRKKG